MADRRRDRLPDFYPSPSGNRSILERCSEADGASRPAVNNDCTTAVGHRHADDFCAINRATVSADHYHPSDGWDRKNRQAALAVCLEYEPKRVWSEHCWRWRKNAGGLHKVLGPRDPHDKGRVASILRSLAASSRQSQDRRLNSWPSQKANSNKSPPSAQIQGSACNLTLD
jgi:hypothetical protein